MRKPHAITASFAYSSRLMPHPPSMQVWSTGTSPSSFVGLSNALAVSVPASSFAHADRAEVEEAAVAPRLFHLLQLQLRASLLGTNAVNSTAGSSAESSSIHLGSGQEERSSSSTPSLFMLNRLRREVHLLGDVLLSHYYGQRRLGAADSHKAGDTQTPGVRSAIRQSGSSKSSGPRTKKENRTPVQLIRVPSDSEQTWLRPLQLDTVQHILTRLTLTERLYQATLNAEERKEMQRPSPMSRTQPAAPSSSRSSRNLREAGSTSEPDVYAETALFFQECARVAATLAALQDLDESDGQSLACLVHVLRTSATAGAPLSASVLIEEATNVQTRDGTKKTAAAAGSDSEPISGVPSSSSDGASRWRSCVPWLLHRYVATHVATCGAPGHVDWAVATAWMTTAADRVCATEATQLLHLSSTGNGSLSRTPRPSEHAPSVLFEPWQRVLEEEGNDGTPAHMETAAAAPPFTNLATTTVLSTEDAELRSWILGLGTPSIEKEEGREEGSLQPYWTAVVREMHCSGAQATETLMSLVTSANTMRKDKPTGRHTDSDSSAKAKDRQSPHDASLTSTAALLKDLQFHAIGSYVALRRITSSLQRHRRLVPLLQLHSLVSGYQSIQNADTQRKSGNLSSSRTSGDELPKAAQPTASRSNAFHAAAQRRDRVLTGELLGVATGQQQRQHRSDRRTPCDEVALQAGAMLWREVALLDAYTLITLGHVSEHAVDVAALEKSSVLQQLSWLQQECVDHLRALENTPHGSHVKDSNPSPSTRKGDSCGDGARVGSSSRRLSRARAKVLRSRLTPRTRATLIEKLQEGLRLSAKMLARWGEAERICQLYQAHPAMGASWEVGRALLQCGHYETAVAVLQTLLETPSRAGQRSSTSSSLSLPSTSTTSASLLTSSAVAVRQLLLEAVRGAASALVAQQSAGGVLSTASFSTAAVPPFETGLATPSRAKTLEDAETEDDVQVNEREMEAPLPAELRAQLHSLYTHSASLPVPLPLCLHAVMQGLTEADSATEQQQSLPDVSLPLSASAALQDDEQLRRTAVLCTYVLRCHLAERPSRGLLSKTVELWAANVVRYLCRRGGKGKAVPQSTAFGSAWLSMTDRYLREVTVRLMYGYPHLPVARLLLTRLLQQWTLAASTPTTVVPDAGGSPPSSTGRSGSAVGGGLPEQRAAVTMQWLLRHLFRFAEGDVLSSDRGRKAYPVCTPDTAMAAGSVAAPDGRPGTPWWNADFTERYTQDTLRLMPRIALEHLARFLGSGDGAIEKTEAGMRHIFERVQVALHCRVAEEDAQHQPWQCATCFLWNGRYTSECKRCHTLATSLLQCRTCEFFTSSAGYRPEQGLSCEACGTVLVAPAGEPAHANDNAERSQLQLERDHQDETTSDPSFRLAGQGPFANRSDGPSFVGAATVTGSGRPASLFLDSASVLHVVPLRPWTCTYCRTTNEAQHVFFCRGCRRPPTTDSTRPIAAAAATVVEPCGCCGHLAKTVEGRLSPWCERCGSLHKRLQRLFAATSAPTVPRRTSGTLWWCTECASSFNPWRRTHCSLCGAGRPAAALAGGLSRTSGGAAVSSNGRDDESAFPSSALADFVSRWRPSAAAPYITVPWSMRPCAACAAPNRVGAHLCWKCGVAQSLPTLMRESIGIQWRHWLTQVTHVVTLAGEEEVPLKGTKREGSPDVLKTNPGSTTPLLLPRTESWVCLREGCLHLNSNATSLDVGDAGSLPFSRPVCCAACHAPRHHAEVFNPFHDRLCWHGEEANADSAVNPVHNPHTTVVEAFLLPQPPPHPTERTVVAPMETVPSDGSVRPLRVLRRTWDASAAATCVCCGTAAKGEDGASKPSSLRESHTHPSQPVRVRPLFLVTVCSNCGHCAWGRSCDAYEAAVDASPLPSVRHGYLPGEEALALRVLLRSLAQSVRLAVTLEEVKRRAGHESNGGNGGGVSGVETSHAAAGPLRSARAPEPALDWAWLSHHVLSAAQLLAGDDATGSPRKHCTETDSAFTQQEEARRWLRDELLPWRGCDVASAQQLCSTEPRVAVLSDATGTVHSALVDVREVLESLCYLVELRTSDASPSPRSSRRIRGPDGRDRKAAPTLPLPPPCLQDAWTRRLLVAALELIDVVNRSTVCDEIGFATLRRLCRLLRPHEVDYIDTETKWQYLQEMKLSRSSIVHHCVQCERCLTNHGPEQPCATL